MLRLKSMLTMTQEITNLLMKFDIISIGQISYSVPAKKLHSRKHLLNCRGVVCVQVWTMSTKKYVAPANQGYKIFVRSRALENFNTPSNWDTYLTCK